jgi:hypothetical protein
VIEHPNQIEYICNVIHTGSNDMSDETIAGPSLRRHSPWILPNTSICHTLVTCYSDM